MESGGGISLFRSFLTIYGNCTLEGNVALVRGGGIYAVSSTITISSDTASPTHFLALYHNTADKGGGVYFEANSQLNIRKSTDTDISTIISLSVLLANNVAYYGGGLFIADETSAGICNSVPSETRSPASECFIQEVNTFKTQSVQSAQTHSLFMSGNIATSGSNIFGGLLDRCTVSSAASLMIFDLTNGRNLQPQMGVQNGISLLRQVSDVTDLDTLASDPVRVCFCVNNQHDCSYQHSSVNVRRGETFLVPVVAVDQINRCLLYTSPSPRDATLSRMPSSA